MITSLLRCIGLFYVFSFIIAILASRKSLNFDIQLHHFLFQAFWGCSKDVYYNWYHLQHLMTRFFFLLINTNSVHLAGIGWPFCFSKSLGLLGVSFLWRVSGLGIIFSGICKYAQILFHAQIQVNPFSPQIVSHLLFLCFSLWLIIWLNSLLLDVSVCG